MTRSARREKATAAVEQPDAPARATVVFRCQHRHAGVPYAAGDRLDVSLVELELLQHFDVVELDEGAPHA